MNKIKLKRIPSIVRWILWVLLVQFILVNISAALYAYKLTHFYQDPSLRNPEPNKNILVKTWRLFTGPRQPKPVIMDMPVFRFDSIKLITKKGISIDGWYGRTDSVVKGTVLLFHGITANKGMMIPEASEFLRFGFNVMLIDFRGHGNSGGKTTTIGMRESEEVKLAYDYIAMLGEKNIFLWGSSMGAVVITKAIADYGLKPAGIILEMPFASMQSHLQAKARVLGFPGFPEKPFGFFVTAWIGIERGFNGFKHRTTLYVAKVSCPVLMQWGALDNYVKKSETEKVYNAIPTSKKELVIYDKAGHESLLQQDSEKWRMEVIEFLGRKVF